MGAAAVRWQLCVLLALGACGRLAAGSGLPGKPRLGGRRARGGGSGGGVPGGPPTSRCREGRSPRGSVPCLASLQSNFWDPRGAPPSRSPGRPGLREPSGPAAGAGWGEAPGGRGGRGREEGRKSDGRPRAPPPPPACGPRVGSGDPGAEQTLPQGRLERGRKEARRGDHGRTGSHRKKGGS